MDSSVFDGIVSMINQVGFPIFVAIYSLFTVNKTMKGLTDVLQKIANKLGVDCIDKS